jgi:acyl carrier protein
MSTPALSKADILVAVQDILARQFELAPAKIVPGARLVQDLDLDSIDWIDMAVALEVETGHRIREEELESIRTIQDVVDVVHRKLHEAPADNP